MKISTVIILIIAILAIINFYSGNGVLTQVAYLIESNTGQTPENLAMCLTGSYMFLPAQDFMGFLIPTISIKDIIAVLILVFISHKLISMRDPDWSTKRKVAIYAGLSVFYWLLLKAIGFGLIALAGQSCFEFVSVLHPIISPLTIALLILGIPILFWFISVLVFRK